MAPPRLWDAQLVRYHADERRMFYGDIFNNPDGDINIVYLHPNIPIAWHRHQRQHDRLFIIDGVVRLRVFETNPRVDGVEHILIPLPRPRDVLYIPENHWHGYEAIGNHAVLLQFNGPGKWDGSDEERHPIDAEMPWEWDA